MLHFNLGVFSTTPDNKYYRNCSLGIFLVDIADIFYYFSVTSRFGALSSSVMFICRTVHKQAHQLLHPTFALQKGPIAAKGLCQGGHVASYLGVFGISRYRWYRTRLDRKLRDTGSLSVVSKFWFQISG